MDRDIVLFANSKRGARNHMQGNHVAVSTVCDEQWKEFHLLNKSVGTRPLNEHVMHFVGSCFLVPMLIGFRPLQTVSLLSLIMSFVLELSCDHDRRVADAVALGDPITEACPAVRTGCTTTVGCRHIHCLSVSK